MELEALSGAASIALISAIAFMLLAKSWHAVTKSVGRNSNFPGSVMREAAQRFREEMDRLTRRLRLYLTSAFVFLVIFSVSYFLRPREIFSDLPTWQSVVILAASGAAALYAAGRVVKVLLARRRTRFARDANIAAGHGLQKLTANRNRVFHDLPCGGGIIDDVIVGLHGVYAIYVVARRSGKDKRVRLNDDTLIFAPGEQSLSLAEFGQRTKQLAREFSKVLEHEVHVRSVIAVPGWEIDSQASDEYLVVNERNLAMLRGWKEQKDYLMNEDVEKLQSLLTERCTRDPRR